MTTNEGKIYSNGLPLQLYATLSQEEIIHLHKQIIALLQRILTFPMVTIAALNGMDIHTTHKLGLGFHCKLNMAIIQKFGRHKILIGEYIDEFHEFFPRIHVAERNYFLAISQINTL